MQNPNKRASPKMPILAPEILFTNILLQNCLKRHNGQNTASYGNIKLFSCYFGQSESFKYYNDINIRRERHGKRASADNFHFSSMDINNDVSYVVWLIL